MKPTHCTGCGKALQENACYPTKSFDSRSGQRLFEVWALGCPNGQAYQHGNCDKYSKVWFFGWRYIRATYER